MNPQGLTLMSGIALLLVFVLVAWYTRRRHRQTGLTTKGNAGQEKRRR